VIQSPEIKKRDVLGPADRIVRGGRWPQQPGGGGADYSEQLPSWRGRRTELLGRLAFSGRIVIGKAKSKVLIAETP